MNFSLLFFSFFGLLLLFAVLSCSKTIRACSAVLPLNPKRRLSRISLNEHFPPKSILFENKTESTEDSYLQLIYVFCAWNAQKCIGIKISCKENEPTNRGARGVRVIFAENEIAKLGSSSSMRLSEFHFTLFGKRHLLSTSHSWINSRADLFL